MPSFFLKTLKDRIYIAGALNSDSCGYIKNLHRMIVFAEKVRSMGAAVYVPGNDFLHGLVTGSHEYDDYFMNSMEWLLSCDAMALTPGWEQSKGTQREIELAKKNGIPVLYHSSEVKKFLNRPRILCIVGESGSGKSYAAKYLESYYGIPLLRSYTDRERRGPDDNDHTFLSRGEFSELKHKDMVAFTDFGDYRYCCLHSDIKQLNSYVIDERGLSMLRSRHRSRYRIAALRVKRDLSLRLESVEDHTRIERDEGRFFLDDKEFEYHILNDTGLDDFRCNLRICACNFFGIDNVVESLVNNEKVAV